VDLLVDGWNLRSRVRRSNRRESQIHEAMHALIVLFFVWSLLASISCVARSRLGTSGAALLSFLALIVWLLATRSHRRDRGPPVSSALLLLGVLGGFASFPAWVAAIAATGIALGLEPVGATTPGASGPTLWTATVLLAPVFEELLYRERLVSALRPVLGTGSAIVATSALFAVPHLEPWRVLGTLLVGLMLGSAICASGSLALCIGLHMGLNLAGWACGVPPVRMALSPETAALAGIGGLAAGIALARWTRPRPDPQRRPRPVAAFTT
jgi:membrane protease YdiL (CAAX protease family)